MKAVAVFPQSRTIKIIDAQEPALEGHTAVKLRMLEVGVCGTDKEIASFAYGAPPQGADHLILGHESLARVDAVGKDVKTLKPGDLAVLMVRRPCAEASCRACLMGRQDFCESGRFSERGINRRHGYMAEFVADEEKYVVPLPPDLGEIGVLIEPLTIAEKAVAEALRIQDRLPYFASRGRVQSPRSKAVVLGAGPVALLGAMLLRSKNCDVAVYSLEPQDDPKAALVKSLGASYYCSKETTLSQLAQDAGPIDLVYEATGAAPLAFEALEYLGTNGIFIFTGVPGRKGPISLDADLLMRRLVLQNQLVLGSVNAPRQAFEDAAKDLALFLDTWPKTVRALISGRHAMEDFAAPLSGKLPGVKHVIQIGKHA